MNSAQFSYFRYLPLLILALLWATVATAGDGTARNELHALLDAFLEGASINDVKMHDRFWAEDLIYTSSAGERRGKAEIMTALGSAPEADPGGLPEYSAEGVNIRVFDDFAVITFRLVAGMPDGNANEYFNTGVFRLDDGNWRAFTWQATRIPATESVD